MNNLTMKLKGRRHGAFKYETPVDEEIELVDHLGRFLRDVAPPLSREMHVDTPLRWMKAMREMTSGYDVDIPSLFKTFDGIGYDGMVVVDVPFWSLCEHHLLPFHGTAWVGYLPGKSKRVVGLSKLARLVDAHARRLQVQERLTADIAKDLRTHLQATGVGVRIESVHTCMCARGIKKEGTMRTQTLLGQFRRGAVNGEFNSLINRGT